jgi:hypothetical protein
LQAWVEKSCKNKHVNGKVSYVQNLDARQYQIMPGMKQFSHSHPGPTPPISLFLGFGSSSSVEAPSASASHDWLSRTRKSSMPNIVCQCLPLTPKPLLSLLSFQAHFKASIGWQLMFTNTGFPESDFFQLMPIHQKTNSIIGGRRCEAKDGTS